MSRKGTHRSGQNRPHFLASKGGNRGKSKGVCGGSEEGEAARMEGQGVTSLRESRGAPSPWTLLPTDLAS